MLSDRPAGTKAYPQGHYLVPDTNALLNAMDLFEQGSAFFDVIILQTVLEELRNRSLPLYNRLIGLTKSQEKRFYVFFNEFRLETYVNREQDESINDRNDRAVRCAVKWYNDHLGQTKSKKVPVTVMLSDDRGNLEKAKQENIPAIKLRDYVSGLKDAERLLDMIAESQERIVSKEKRAEFFYPEYISLSKMMTGVKSGMLHQGIFNVSPYNYLEGSIKVPAFPRPLLILGRDNINRSVDGDVVVVEVLPQDQWKAPSTKIIEEEAITKNENADNDEDTAGVVTEKERRALQEEVKKTQGLTTEGRPQPTAKVVGVIKRNWRQYVGHVDPSSVSQTARQGRKQESVFLIPMDKKIPRSGYGPDKPVKFSESESWLPLILGIANLGTLLATSSDRSANWRPRLQKPKPCCLSMTYSTNHSLKPSWIVYPRKVTTGKSLQVQMIQVGKTGRIYEAF